MPAERQVHIVDDPGDSGELPAMLNHLADTRPGMAVCHITPGLARPGDLAADVLVSLGKRFDALRVEQAGKRAWQLVNIWLQAERTRHLFVLRAHHLNRRLAELLISTVDEHTRLQRSLPANQHLDVEHTTILRFILDGWDSPGWAKAARTTVKRLVDTGLVEPGRHYTPTPEVAFSLRLDDERYNSDY